MQEVGEKCNFDNLKKNRIDPTAFLSSGVKTSLFRKGNVSIFSLYTIYNIYNPSKVYYMLPTCNEVMGFNATFNNISVISWRSVLFVGETREFIENHKLSTGPLMTRYCMNGVRTHNFNGS
jgi:hypothetical protein